MERTSAEERTNRYTNRVLSLIGISCFLALIKIAASGGLHARHYGL